MKTRGVIGAALAAALFGVPATASADVLQVGNSGAEWVAGGPSAAGQFVPAGNDRDSGILFIGEEAPASVQDTPLAVEADLHPRSVTQALDAAGPTRWRARVAQLAAKYDISPALLEAVVWQESRWNERAISPVGARGLAQLMPGTAAEMGVDSRDPMANLEGGARYLRMQLDAFGGDVEKALAAYNAGPARVEKAGGIPNIRETKEYVAAIMARLTDSVRQ
ncbi:lytic transglycosylase domain-containing protein [Novosphingobium mangrovi (ex Huang et al. 2023)]|uniref:Lytic transglycosylase domain-containing protein n=1 Tax=Novosphingobium mangrovi (ex Huang et al. 2023) TaxID=2976432 RepID=A0ABT2I9V6_9SPHN|nr:lytic transglycosylase domain-containing protein [Novosphingobium mangrovi (ex Huang et al. 2023)]MCT2401615.1 lytic transglycosylase domain-containing protein [Novosphingobium mangrovi (ex Huang et al. 2023)]